VRQKKQERVRFAAAWLCLLAVTLIYAPMAGAAWLAHNMDKMACCAGGYCPIAAHHHQKQKRNSSQNSMPMDCGHEMGGMDGMMSCSMSCCQNPARPALIPGAFLLPAVNFAPPTDEISHPVLIGSAFEISRFAKPHSPPPRTSSSFC